MFIFLEVVVMSKFLFLLFLLSLIFVELCIVCKVVWLVILKDVLLIVDIVFGFFVVVLIGIVVYLVNDFLFWDKNVLF